MEKKGLEKLSEAVQNGSMELFLKSGDIEKIIITGSDRVSLQEAGKLLEKDCKDADTGKRIPVEIAEDIQACCRIDKNAKVISLSDEGASYINQSTEFEAGAVSAGELRYFISLAKTEKVDEGTIKSWADIFGYQAVAFCSSNKYIDQLVMMIKKCGMQVYSAKQLFQDNKAGANFLFALDVLSFSEDGKHYEKIEIPDLMDILEFLCYFKQVTGHDLTFGEYIEAGAACLKGLQEDGFDAVLFGPGNAWTEKIKDKIKEGSGLEVADKAEDVGLGKRYIVDSACMGKSAGESYIISMKHHFLRYACEYAVYERICRLCRNVYIYPAQLHIFDEFRTCVERDRYNFLHHKEKFPDNFVRDICGDEEYPLDEVLRDMQDCQPVKINDGYMKLSSNYRSRYFNTDTYGSRVVVDAPADFSRTIWLAGACNFVGYAVEDKHTTASRLQKIVNGSGYPYRVVDLSCDAATSFTLFDKILDRDIAPDDIIIILEHALILKEKEVDVDYREIDKIFGNKLWYWDGVGHPGQEGYQIIAEKIFDSIKQAMVMDARRDHKFHVDKALEPKVLDFITGLKNNLYKNNLYKNDSLAICHNTDHNIYADRRCKTGAIVMNCNPFTYGHQYLVETASRLVDLLYIFVVEENKSIFPFEDRFRMVKEGVKQYENVAVVPSGEFMISTLTFPGYFLKDSPTKECYDTFLDLKIFAHYIAPALRISMRFVGEEPTDRVTAQYNQDMKVILGDAGIDVIEIPRKRHGGEVISASKVRRLLEQKDYAALEKYVPGTTLKYLAME